MPLDQLANDPLARSPTGEIIDQKGTPLTETKTEPETKVEPEVKTEPEVKEGDTLLTKKDEPEKKDEPAKAPEKYEPFKVPEGFTLSEPIAAEAGTLFKELNLSQDQAQKLIDFHAAKTREAAEAPGKLWADTQEEWVKAVRADSEIGSKLPVVKQTIAKAIDSLPAPLAAEFRQAMDYTGAGNNPAFIKAFYKFATQLTEGGHVSGGGPSSFGQAKPSDKPASLAAAMYPTLPTGR